MKVLIHNNRGHRVYPELNKDIDYPYFCPQCDENFYGVECSEAELDAEVAHRVHSSNGDLWLDKAGNVILQTTNDQCGKVVWFDLKEFEEVWGKKPESEIDILDLRGVFADGGELIFSDYRERLTNN